MLKKTEEEALYFKTEVEKLKNELKEQIDKNKSLQGKLSVQETLFKNKMIKLNKEKMVFDQEKREFHSNQAKGKTKIEKKWRELNQSRDQLNREKTAIEKKQAEQDARESALEKVHEDIDGLRAQIAQDKLSQERYFKQEEIKLEQSRDELLKQKKVLEQEYKSIQEFRLKRKRRSLGSLQHEMLEAKDPFEQKLCQPNKSIQEILKQKNSLIQESQQKRKKHDEEWEKTMTHQNEEVISRLRLCRYSQSSFF